MDPPGSERKGARVRNRERGSAMRWSGREGVTACQAAFRPRRTPCRTDSLEKTLMLGKIEGGRRRG